MYLDLLAQNNYINVNKKLLKLVGIPAALYWAELQNVMQKVVKKNTFNEAGFFKLDRSYMKEQTTLTDTEQYECDLRLKAIGVLEQNETDPDSIRVNAERLVAIVTSEDTTVLKDVASVTKNLKTKKKASEEQKQAKTAGRIANLKKFVVEEDLSVYIAACNWIDSIFESGKYTYKMTKACVNTFLTDIHKYSSDPRVIKTIIDHAAAHCYTEAAWAISLYERNLNSSVNMVAQQKQYSGVYSTKVDNVQTATPLFTAGTTQTF